MKNLVRFLSYPPASVPPVGSHRIGLDVMNSKSLEDKTRTPPQSDTACGVESLLPKIVRFDELARCGEEIWIENDGKLYRLRRTRQGKLILTRMNF